MNSTASNTSSEKCPSWQLNLLMQKLRQKSKGQTLTETAKNVRSAIQERRCQIDPVENQKYLDELQSKIKVKSLQTMVEKLEMVTRQQGLKFTAASGVSGSSEWFISSDMFYLELLIDSTGLVQEVKIQHDGKAEQQNCPEIVDCLRRYDFPDFTSHLEGLVSIYQLNADKKTRSKVFIALQALETDLVNMASTYNYITDGETHVMKSLIGLVEPRRGGHPTKLIFYISPYEFLDTKTKKSYGTDPATIIEKKLGTTATVSVQAYSSHKLQMNTTVTITRTPDGKCIPRYSTLNATNSTALPACFSVNLQSPIPICSELLLSIQTTTGIQAFELVNLEPMMKLITNHTSKGVIKSLENQGLFVNLPDQNHRYFLTETEQMLGMLISSIPFTLASQLPQVIATLRQQQAFNTLIASCVRTGSFRDPDSIVFEINALSHQNISVSFQHPLEESLVTLEFDLRDVSHPQCHLHAFANATDIIPTLEEYACKVVHRTMSIPVTLRAVIRRWQSLKIKIEPPQFDFNLRVGSSSCPPSSNTPSLPEPEISSSCRAESERGSGSTGQQSGAGMVINWNNTITGTSPPKNIINPPFTISPLKKETGSFPNSMDLISPYITLSNLQNFNSNMVSLLASQMGSSSQSVGAKQSSSSVLMSLLDQVGQRERKRKRKIESSDQGGGFLQKFPQQGKTSSLAGCSTSKLLNELGLDTPSPFTQMLNNYKNEFKSAGEAKGSGEEKKKIQHPKRSMSLDSSLHEASSSFESSSNSEGTPLNIVPMSTPTSVSSMLASMRPGIEIIPLPHSSVTVTPIAKSSQEKKRDEGSGDAKKKIERKRKFDEILGGGSKNYSLSKTPTVKPGTGSGPSSMKKINISRMGGKPSVSALKSVSVSSPFTSSFTPITSKAKIGSKEKLKPILPSGFQGKSILQKDFSSISLLPKTEGQKGSGGSTKIITPSGNVVKKGGLLAVIDKLKSQQSTGEGEGGSVKKEVLSKFELLKSLGSSVELSKIKGGGPGSEYSIKQSGQGQGLKLTLNKTKLKEKSKSFGALKSGTILPGLKKGFVPSRAIGSPKAVPKKEGEINKKIFMPGAGGGIFGGPKFDNKFQIPKKNRTGNVERESPPESICPVEPVELPTEPPTLTVASEGDFVDEKTDEAPPILLAELPHKGEGENEKKEGGGVERNESASELISPLSPDNSLIEHETLKTTPTIPTTPLSPCGRASPDEDALIMEETPACLTPESMSQEKIHSSPPLLLESRETNEVEVEDLSSKDKRSFEFESLVMPPPPPPELSSSSPSPVVPIVSVHIVHSPQPNSPALLRSPLVVVQSPHSAHPSPYSIDDELMDEALIG